MTDQYVDYDREPVALPSGGGRNLNVLGNPWTVKLKGEQTAGALAVLEGTFAPGQGAPLHRHQGHDEAFYVVSGSFLFRSGEDSVEVDAGGFFYLPRALPHAFKNIGGEPGSLLGLMTPAGFEDFFVELGSLPPGRPDPAAMQAIVQKYDQELLER